METTTQSDDQAMVSIYPSRGKRKANFSRRQIETLLDEITIPENSDILFSYNFTPFTNEQKENLWKTITDKVNAADPLSENRTVSNVRRKWVNLLSFTKKRFIENSQCIKIMTPIERRIIGLVNERPSLWNDAKRNDSADVAKQLTSKMNELSKRYGRQYLHRTPTPPNMEPTYWGSNSKKSSTRTTSPVQSSFQTSTYQLSETRKPPTMQSLENQQSTTAPSTAQSSNYTSSYQDQNLSHFQNYDTSREGSESCVNDDSSGHSETGTHSTDDFSADYIVIKQEPVDICDRLVNNSPSIPNTEHHVTSQESSFSAVPSILEESNSHRHSLCKETESSEDRRRNSDFFCEFEKAEQQVNRKRKFEENNLTFVERERLEVEKERLNVEKERLDIERRRLQIEEMKLALEQERFKAEQERRLLMK